MCAGGRVLCVLVAVGAVWGSDETKVIYGSDNRRDYYEASPVDQFRLHNHAVAFVKTEELGEPDESGVYDSAIYSPSLFTSHNVCPWERFAEQNTMAFCSGTLIGVDRVLTAAHCVSECDDSFRMVFDYHIVDHSGALGEITEEDVYSCRRVYRRLETKNSAVWDYAVIQLDRPVVGRVPAPVIAYKSTPMANRISPRTSLFMYGYPSGLPGKSDSGAAVVRDNYLISGQLDFFEGTTDSFGGNSGSGIFDASGNVVGILVRGKEDYIYNPKEKCRMLHVVDCSTPNCRELYNAESISYAVVANRAAPECTRDSDCSSSLTGRFCDLSCAPGQKCCTGWCSSYSKPRNYDPSTCAAHFSKSGSVTKASVTETSGPIIGSIVVAAAVAVAAAVGIVVTKVVRSPKRSWEEKSSDYTSLQKPSTKAPAIFRPRLIPVTIPENSAPGSSFMVTTPANTTVEVTVPANAAGQTIHVQY